MSIKRYDPLKIMFVEDEPGTRERVTKLLKRRLTNVYVAENGQEAWDLFQTHQPEVVITDLNLPDISGLALIEKIRNVNIKTSVMIITAYNESAYLLQAIELGVSNFLIKPLNIERLDMGLGKIHEVFMMEAELERQRQYARTVLDFQESLVTVTDGHTVMDTNKRFREFFDLTSIEPQSSISLEEIAAISTAFPSFHRFSDSDWNKIFEDVLKIKLKDQKTGQWHYFRVKAAPFPNRPQNRIISFTDITELENERQYYKKLAIIDPLTQVYNRIQFNRSLSEEIQKAARYSSVFALVMFDIDHFKRINDTYGHQLGDKILVELADLVKNHIREVDIFARFGGEEFVILTPETDLAGVKVMAEKLRKEIEEYPFSHSETLTCSFGVSMYKKNDKPDDLIKRVDDRLYRAKNNGRNQVCDV